MNPTKRPIAQIAEMLEEIETLRQELEQSRETNRKLQREMQRLQSLELKPSYQNYDEALRNVVAYKERAERAEAELRALLEQGKSIK